STPTGIGNLAAKAILDFRHTDGANQLGNEPGGILGMAYSDYTGYTPVNGPMDIRVPFDPTVVHNPNAWQPLRYVDASANVVTPGFVGAHWQRVTPFALSSQSQLRSTTGPATHGSVEYWAQAQALLELSSGLTDEQKMIAEYWADGPHSELPPGHWNLAAGEHQGDPEGAGGGGEVAGLRLTTRTSGSPNSQNPRVFPSSLSPTPPPSSRP